MFMSSKMRLTSLLAAFVVVAGLAATAQATVHPLSGSLRFQIGDGLPIPITFAPAPGGVIFPVPGAVVTQPPGVGVRDIVFGAGKEFKYTVATKNQPVFLFNSVVYQVKTSLGITYPLNAGSKLSARTVGGVGGRSGAATVSFCDGNGLATGPNWNPQCLNGAGGGTSLTGLLIYTRTANQFGGPLTGRVFGGADVAIVGGGSQVAPCNGPECKVLMALANPNSTGDGGAGGFFGGTGTSPGTAVPNGAFTGTITPAGAITGVGLISGDGLANPNTSAGAPWTTGMVTVSASQAVGSPEVFTLTGSDNRTIGGAGTISLVAGSISQRAVTGPNANRGWLNMTLGPALGALPSMSGPGIAALVGLMSLAGGYAMRQRNRK